MPGRFLFITYRFLPSDNIGAVRSAKLAKYLPQFGWEPLVLTAQPATSDANPCNRNEVLRIAPCWQLSGPYRLESSLRDATNSVKSERRDPLRYIRTFRPVYTFPGISVFAVEPFGWYAATRRLAVDRALGNVSLVFSTHPPSTTHLLASHVSHTANIPWVAEYRDLWSQNPYSYWNGYRIPEAIGRIIERLVLRSSSLIITVSPPWKDQLEFIHDTKVQCIPSGFDPDDYLHTVSLTEHFTLTHTGSSYPGKRDASALLLALRLLRQEEPLLLEGFELRFVGGEFFQLLSQEIHDYGLSDSVRFYRPVPFEENLRMQRESSALLLLGWNDPRDAGTYPGKVFQYLGAKRPILATSVYERGVVSDLLDRTGCGVVANDAEHIMQVLRAWITEFRREGKIQSFFAPKPAILSEYTWENQARKLAQAFDSVINATHGH